MTGDDPRSRHPELAARMEAQCEVMANRWAEGRDIRTGKPLAGRDLIQWELMALGRPDDWAAPTVPDYVLDEYLRLSANVGARRLRRTVRGRQKSSGC